MINNNSKYKTIGQVAEVLNLIDKNGKKLTYILRFWEKEFKQIKPKIFTGNRRYYDDQTIQILKNIKYLLKDKGMTINGVKKLLNSKDYNVDETNKVSINAKNVRYRIQCSVSTVLCIYCLFLIECLY